MRLTTKGRYAVTAMLDLAIHTTHGPIKLAEISQRQEISLSYLEQLFAKLRRGKLVESVRGPGGGYLLANKPADISIARIIDSVSESIDVTRCQGEGNCDHGQQCLTHHLWCDLSDAIYSFLNGITLSDLIARRDVQLVAQRQQDKLTGGVLNQDLLIASQ